MSSLVPDKRRDETLTAFREDVLRGLSSKPKTLPCKWLYDARGSKLFERICETEEYYVTRTELALLRKACPRVAAHVGPHADVLEPGSGAGEKIRLLLDALDRPRSYVPIDISETAVAQSAETLRADYPQLHLVPVVADFTHPFSLPREFSEHPESPKLVFFPGSTISNFAPPEALEFLVSLRQLLAPGEFLFIGVDLVKAKTTLEAAYDDSEGITAEFNLNLLRRIRRELDATIDESRFRHRAVYNETESRIEMHLESLEHHVFEVEGESFEVEPGETIHTENSYKYTVEGFLELAKAAHFQRVETFVDPKQLFSLHLLRSN